MATKTPHTFSVFLADDDADDRFLFEEALMQVRNKIRITLLNNGEQLMTRLEDKKSHHPNLIFLDLNMPLKNGIECLEEIKNNDKLIYIPVVIFSTSKQKETVNHAYNKGANFYMYKPDNFERLKLLLDKVFSLSAKSLTERPDRDNFIISV